MNHLRLQILDQTTCERLLERLASEAEWLDGSLTAGVHAKGVHKETRWKHTCFWLRDCGRVRRLEAVASSVRHLPLLQFSVCPAERAQYALTIIWGDGQDSIRSFWPLTDLMRCRDK